MTAPLNTDEKIIALLKERGPLTGSELFASAGGDHFSLWKTCMLSESLIVKKTGTRFMRLDRRVEGFARLSPSILREFLTYSIIGLRENPSLVDIKATETIERISSISIRKAELAAAAAADIIASLGGGAPEDEELCIILAGDTAYGMAHDVPRPERSTGKMVNGSDLDLVFILSDTVSENTVKKLDEAVYQAKYRLLINPSVREELDYVVKNMSRVREQAAFDSFKKMVACKILDEGRLLMGSSALFEEIKSVLKNSGAAVKLEEMRGRARIFGKNAEQYFLSGESSGLDQENTCLFYSTDEFEEFE